MKKLGVIFDLSSLVLDKKCVSVTLNTPEPLSGRVWVCYVPDIRMDDNVFITAPGKPNINIQLPLTKIHVIHRN